MSLEQLAFHYGLPTILLIAVAYAYREQQKVNAAERKEREAAWAAERKAREDEWAKKELAWADERKAASKELSDERERSAAAGWRWAEGMRELEREVLVAVEKIHDVDEQRTLQRELLDAINELRIMNRGRELQYGPTRDEQSVIRKTGANKPFRGPER